MSMIIVPPSGDMTGITDTQALQTAVDGSGGQAHIHLPGQEYYFTRTAGIGLIDLRASRGEYVHRLTISGNGMYQTTLHMVGVEPRQGADWYLFHLKNTIGFTLRDLTITSDMLETASEQTHGVVAHDTVGLTIQNVRGLQIYGDTVKMIGRCDNGRFLNTEHINNGRSGISMRGYDNPNPHTGGGIVIDGFLSIGIPDQAIDMEPGFYPGEISLSNGRVYPGPDNPGLCLAIVSTNRIAMNNWQVYGPMYLFSADQIIITNMLIDATGFGKTTLLIQKGCGDVIVGNTIITGDGVGDGLVKLTVHNSGRPNRVMLHNLILNISNEPDTGTAVHLYDVQNVSLDNIMVNSSSRLGTAVQYRGVTDEVDAGAFRIHGLQADNARWGVRFASSADPVSWIDTLSVQGSHFRRMENAIRLENGPGGQRFIRAWNFDGNVYGEGVDTAVWLGSGYQD